MYMHLIHVLYSNGDWVSYLNKIMLLFRIVEGTQWLSLVEVVVQSIWTLRALFGNLSHKHSISQSLRHMMVIQWVMPSFKTHTYRMIKGISWDLLGETEKQNCPDSKKSFRHQKKKKKAVQITFPLCNVLCDLLKPIYSE